MFWWNFRRNGAVEAAKHPTTTTTFITITAFFLPAATRKKLTLIAPSTTTNAQENDVHLLALPLIDMTRGCRTGILSGPGPISKTSTGPQHSLLGAKLCCMIPQLGGWGTPRRSHQGSARPSYPHILCAIPGSHIGSISQLFTLPPY